MAAGDHLNSRQFETVYRGLGFGEGEHADVERMHADPVGYLHQQGRTYRRAGIHWTDHPGSAENFALDRDPEGWAHEGFGDDDDEPGHEHGVILHGSVSSRHVVQPGTKEWENYAMGNAIFDRSHPESETTVRGGRKVRVSHVTAVSVDPDGFQRETTVPYRRNWRA